MLDLQAAGRFMVKRNEASGTGCMADADANEADALTRLEAALDRIARHNARPAPLAGAVPLVDTVLVASRLDRLIGQLRHALAEEA